MTTSEINEYHKTKRTTVNSIEEILEKEFPILDHGFVRVIDYMGSDASITRAARISYGSGTKQVSQDKALINYLMRHKHTTPFEMCEIKFHIKLPIFVARQWIRHRTANINEYSARYSIVDNEFYIPNIDDVAHQSEINAQGRGEKTDSECAEIFLKELKENTDACYKSYQKSLDKNLSREIARVTLPLNCYTQIYWKIDLHNLLHFIHLRSDHHAQFEIREYSKAIEEIVKAWVPVAYDAFVKHRKESSTISRDGLRFLKSQLLGQENDDIKLGKREKNELIEILKELEEN